MMGNHSQILLHKKIKEKIYFYRLLFLMQLEVELVEV
jgi:hypothetical protein